MSRKFTIDEKRWKVKEVKVTPSDYLGLYKSKICDRYYASEELHDSEQAAMRVLLQRLDGRIKALSLEVAALRRRKTHLQKKL